MANWGEIHNSTLLIGVKSEWLFSFQASNKQTQENDSYLKQPGLQGLGESSNHPFSGENSLLVAWGPWIPGEAWL